MGSGLRRNDGFYWLKTVYAFRRHLQLAQTVNIIGQTLRWVDRKALEDSEALFHALQLVDDLAHVPALTCGIDFSHAALVAKIDAHAPQAQGYDRDEQRECSSVHRKVPLCTVF
jgi:hypothetical protein